MSDQFYIIEYPAGTGRCESCGALAARFEGVVKRDGVPTRYKLCEGCKVRAESRWQAHLEAVRA